MSLEIKITLWCSQIIQYATGDFINTAIAIFGVLYVCALLLIILKFSGAARKGHALHIVQLGHVFYCHTQSGSYNFFCFVKVIPLFIALQPVYGTCSRHNVNTTTAESMQ